MENEKDIRSYFEPLWPLLNERQRRIAAASYAKKLGYGGISLVSKATGLSRVTITKGMHEIEQGQIEPGRIHRPGAGRPALTSLKPSLLESLLSLVEKTTSWDPEAPRLWTLKSTRNLSEEMLKLGFSVSHAKIGQLLRENGYSLQNNIKTEEDGGNVDRDAQFRRINKHVKLTMERGFPVISVATKKKELIGNSENKGQQWRKSKSPRKASGHDFPGQDDPRAFPFGMYDIAQSTGCVSIETDLDSSEFAVNSIKGWWKHQGRSIYPAPGYILITCDADDSNSCGSRAWKHNLQGLADYLNLTVMVCHFPPGTSKWNKIEHSLFSFISSNWRGEPLCEHETTVSLISATKTATGLSLKCKLDHKKYPTGKIVSDEMIQSVNILPAKFRGDWNYVIIPDQNL
ncbi:MAG: ISAzo13 family transposase [Deltaproteobacteria bacterium]|jgi:transposase|nr:ISAzo13 family transposase [Deltaproteobacteria bacterium]